MDRYMQMVFVCGLDPEFVFLRPERVLDVG
jgi:hypothetical protein